MKIELNVDDLSKYLSGEDLKNIVENKISELVQKHYDDSFSNMVYERVDNAISLLIKENIWDETFENSLREKEENKTNSLFQDVSFFSGMFSPKNQYISDEYDLTFLQNIKNKLEKLGLYSTVKILKSDDKMGKMLLIVKSEV